MKHDIDTLYALLSESKLDLMYLPAGAVAWLFDRPEAQVNAAAALGVASRDLNPIVDAALLRSDQNVLILKTERVSNDDGIRVYPGGGYGNKYGEMFELDAAIQYLNGEAEETGTSPCDAMMPPPPPEPEGFSNMAVPQQDGETGVEDEQNALIQQLLQNAQAVEESDYSDHPGAGRYFTYDEIASGAADDIEAHSGEEACCEPCSRGEECEGEEEDIPEGMGDDEQSGADLICKMRSIGSPLSRAFKTTEDEGSTGDAGPIGTDNFSFDFEDDITKILGGAANGHDPRDL